MDYVHERLNCPLVVTDDDVAGTFTFIRALEDHGTRADLTAREIGETWLNYLIERRSILWWGGNGNSTEHTAWLNLKRGIAAPASGSAAVNGQAVAEQIGAQIFIDGWAIVAPGNPALAARLAEQAARVSHDGAAVDAAKLWAAMEAEAFISGDVERLIEVGLAQVSPEGRSRNSSPTFGTGENATRTGARRGKRSKRATDTTSIPATATSSPITRS